MQQLPSAWSLTYCVVGGCCRYSDNDVRPAAQLPAPTGPVVLNGQMTGAAPGGGYYASFVDAHGQQQLYYYPPTQPQPQPQTLQHSQSMYAGYVMTPRSSQPHHALLSTSLTRGVSSTCRYAPAYPQAYYQAPHNAYGMQAPTYGYPHMQPQQQQYTGVPGSRGHRSRPHSAGAGGRRDRGTSEPADDHATAASSVGSADLGYGGADSGNGGRRRVGRRPKSASHLRPRRR